MLTTEFNVFTKQEQLIGVRFYKGKDREEMRLMADMDRRDLLEFRTILSNNKDIKGNVLPIGVNAAGITKVLDSVLKEKEAAEKKKNLAKA